MIRGILIGVLLSTAISMLAQPCHYAVSGRVFDIASGEPLPFANVRIEDTTKGTSTDLNGYFEILELCDEEVHLVISMVGYKTLIHHHDIYHDDLNIYLASDNMLLESITVEGEAARGEFFSLSGGSLDAKVIDQNNEERLGDMLSRISGINTISTGSNVVKPVIHGLHSNRILIINNDLRHEFQNWGIEHAPEIDASMIDRLEVIKGAAAVKYGPDALGGVIKVNSAHPRLHDGIYGDLKTAYYTNGRGTNNSLRLGMGWERIAIQANGSYQQNGDLQSPDYMLSNTGMQEYSYGSEASYHGSKWDIDFQYTQTYQKLSILRASVNESYEDLVRALSSEVPIYQADFTRDIAPPYQEVRHQLARVKAIYRSGGHIFSAHYGYQLNNRKEVDLRRGSSSLIPSINLDLGTHTMEMEWTIPVPDSWSLSVGSQSLVQDNNNIRGTNTVPFVPNFNNYRSGLFAISSKETSLGMLEAGLRYDFQYSSIRGREPDNSIYRHTITFQNLTGSIGWVKDINSVHSLRANLGSAWRPPNIYELYSFGKHQNAFEYGLWRYEWNDMGQLTAGQVLDPDTHPVSSEIGLKGIVTWQARWPSVSTEIATYVNQIQNYLYARPAGITNTVRGVFPYFIFDQTDAIFSGIDLDILIRHTPSLESRVTSSYLYARDILHQSYFIGLPPYNLMHELVWSSKMNGSYQLEISATNRWESRQWMSPGIIAPEELLRSYEQGIRLVNEHTPLFDLVDAPRSFWLLGAQASLTTRKWTLAVKGDNIFNQSYRRYTDRLRYFADQPGSNYLFSISYHW